MLAATAADDLHSLQNCGVRIYRMDPINRRNENERQAVKNRNIRQTISPETRIYRMETGVQRHTNRMLEEFNTNIKIGPTDVCI